MLILPAIDLSNGNCVRLRQGDFDAKTVYPDSPRETARRFFDAGLSFLHIVDLDGAKAGSIKNREALSAIHSIPGLRSQVGGGIRSTDDVRMVFDLGVSRVIVGSVAVQKPELVGEWIREFGAERIVIAMDVRDGFVAYHGWVKSSEQSAGTFLMQMTSTGAKIVLCTDIGRDGMLTGPNVELYRELQTAFPKIELLASGGVSALNDIASVKEAGCAGVVIGKALYEGRITLEQLKQYL